MWMAGAPAPAAGTDAAVATVVTDVPGDLWVAVAVLVTTKLDKLGT